MRKKKLCCSKKMVISSYVITILLTAATLAGSFLTTQDMTPVATITGLAWAETTAAKKARPNAAMKTRRVPTATISANRIKLTNQMVTDLADKYGIDAVVNLAGIVIKD